MDDDVTILVDDSVGLVDDDGSDDYFRWWYVDDSVGDGWDGGPCTIFWSDVGVDRTILGCDVVGE